MIAGTIISDAIAEKQHTCHDIFDFARSLNLKAFKEVISQGIDVAGDYIKTLAPVETKEIRDIIFGHAQIIDTENGILGIYKDEDGNVFTVNRKCPHMGCRLSFNPIEKTWDCPCHGSRFTYLGQVIESPAVTPL